MKKRVFLTGATGTMGREAMLRMTEHPADIELTVLKRRGGKRHRKNHSLVEELERQGKLRVIYGDLRNYEDVRRGVEDADYVLHVGGMVSPAADHCPELTREVNVGSAMNIVRAVKSRGDGGRGVKVVYIGSVAQLGNRSQPLHWGRSGDPVWTAEFDVYGQSKVEAERVIAESGIPCWVSLRQTGILAKDIVAKGADPITFHVPVRGVLEWVSAEDSGNLLCNLVLADLPENFWKRFYNIGGGKGFRLSNYEFEKLILKAMSCPPMEKIFDADWFATRNFHGLWYEDSDELEEWLHFRTVKDAATYFERFRKSLPWYFRLTKLVPAFMIKAGMSYLSRRKPLGTMSWPGRDEARMRAFFGGEDKWRAVPDWEHTDLSHPLETPVRLDHGYDESKPESELDIEDLQSAARFRGGRCLAQNMTPGDLDTPVEWECHDGHRFMMTPRLVLLGGHWCPECFGPDADYEKEAALNPFFAQVYS